MQQCSKIFYEASKNYRPHLVKCNPSLISSIEWLNPTTELFQHNQTLSILPPDIIYYLSALNPEEAFQFLFGFHGINFQFWSSDKDEGFSPYVNNGQSGMFAAIYCFKNFFEAMKKESRLDAFSQADLFQHFQNIPHIAQRYDILKKLWKPFTLEQSFKIVSQACDEGFISSKTIQIIRTLTSSLDDTKEDVFFRKEILFIWDIQVIHNIHHNTFINLQIPMASDHQTAKVFKGYDLLIYSEDVNNIIQKGTHIPVNSEIELAIRSASIILSSQICQYRKISTYELYKTLWAMRKEKKSPFHLTPTTFY